MQEHKREAPTLKESVVVDGVNVRRKSIKRSLQEYGRDNVKDVYISD